MERQFCAGFLHRVLAVSCALAATSFAPREVVQDISWDRRPCCKSHGPFPSFVSLWHHQDAGALLCRGREKTNFHLSCSRSGERLQVTGEGEELWRLCRPLHPAPALRSTFSPSPAASTRIPAADGASGEHLQCCVPPARPAWTSHAAPGCCYPCSPSPGPSPGLMPDAVPVPRRLLSAVTWLWDTQGSRCRFRGTATGVAARQAKIHPVPSCGALWDTPCHLCLGSRQAATVLTLAGQQGCLQPAVEAVPVAFLSALPSNIPWLLCLCFTFINITS